MFIEKAALDEISYTTTLGKSLKQISLSKTPLDSIILDIEKYRAGYLETLTQENLIGTRFKSNDSIFRKYAKVKKNGGGFKQCFNDVLGFRLHFEEYPQEYPDYFRVVNLRSGKMNDDGYRAIHLYYQRDSYSYPIEIQLWCGEDYQFNVWSHRWIYKYEDGNLGRLLYEKYVHGAIKSEEDFIWNMKKLRGEL